MSVAASCELPPIENAATLSESIAKPQCRFTIVLPFSQPAEASWPVTPSDTLVPSSARMHRSDTFPANWAVADAEAVGAVDRNRLANHIGCTWLIGTV